MRRTMIVVAMAALLVPPVGAHGDEARDPPPPRCEMGSCYDPLFTVQYPHRASMVTSDGVRVPLPLHAFDGPFSFIVGAGDADPMTARTHGTDYRPVRTKSGAGIAVLIIGERTDSDIGAFDESVVAFAVSTDDVTIPDDPGAMLAAAVDPANRLWLMGLIVDDRIGVDFVREHLGFSVDADAKAMAIDIDPRAGTTTFEFAELDGSPIISGDLRADRADVLEPGLGFAANGGSRRLAEVMVTRGGSWHIRLVSHRNDASGSLAHLSVVGHPGDLSSFMATACCEGSISVSVATRFGADVAALGFDPRAIVTFSGYRFVVDTEL